MSESSTGLCFHNDHHNRCWCHGKSSWCEKDHGADVKQVPCWYYGHKAKQGRPAAQTETREWEVEVVHASDIESACLAATKSATATTFTANFVDSAGGTVASDTSSTAFISKYEVNATSLDDSTVTATISGWINDSPNIIGR